MCVRSIDFASVSTILILNFEIVLTLWFFLLFILLANINIEKPIANNIYLCSKIEIRYLSVIIHPSYVNHRAYCVIFSPPPCTIICVLKN